MVATSPQPLRPIVNIHEPATLLTDYLLAALGGGLAWRLHSQTSSENLASRWWIRALLAMSISAFVGGSYHGFAPNFPPALSAVWWKSVLIFVCATGFCMTVTLIREIVLQSRQRAWNGIIIAKFLLAVAVVISYPKFLIAMVDYGLAMVAWAVAALWLRRAWSGWMLAAVGFSAIAGWVQQSRSGISIHFNHNDLYHLIQALALIGFYRAGCLLGGRQSPLRSTEN